MVQSLLSNEKSQIFMI